MKHRPGDTGLETAGWPYNDDKSVVSLFSLAKIAASQIHTETSTGKSMLKHMLLTKNLYIGWQI